MEAKVYHKSVKTGGSDTWGTPRELFETLNREFSFTLDGCADASNAKLERFYSLEEDGLSRPWQGERVFLNPPYSQISAWARKAYEESRGGALVVCLVPSRTGSRWFREYMAPGEVRFLTKRIKFLLPSGEPARDSAGFDSAVVILEPGRERSTHYWDWKGSPPPGKAKGAFRERPALRYYGSKFEIAPWIIDRFPGNYRELHYIEPFGGSGAVLLRKEPSFLETYNDLNSQLVTFFRVLRERPNELIERLRLTPYAREEYQQSLLPLMGSVEVDLERARRFFVQYWQSIGGADTRSGWRVGRDKNGRYTPNPESFSKAIENLYRVAGRLRRVQIENLDAFELIRRTDSEESLFYVDPPYLLGTRASKGRSYAHELSDSDHRELFETLRGLSGYVLLSAYEDDLYSELYGEQGWASYTLEARVNGGARAREVLWLNPRLASELSLSLSRAGALGESSRPLDVDSAELGALPLPMSSRERGGGIESLGDFQ